MFDCDNPLVTFLLPCGGAYDAEGAPTSEVARGVTLFFNGRHKDAVDVWRLVHAGRDELVDAWFCLGTAYAMGSGAAEDWARANGMYLLKAVRRGHAAAAYQAALLGLRSPANPRALVRFERAQWETLALLICARTFSQDTALSDRVEPLEEYVRRVYPDSIAAAEKLAASTIKEARIYAPAT